MISTIIKLKSLRYFIYSFIYFYRYACGDVKNPLESSAKLMYNILQDQMALLVLIFIYCKCCMIYFLTSLLEFSFDESFIVTCTYIYFSQCDISLQKRFKFNCNAAESIIIFCM